jgi:hypothetical protein
VTWPQLALVAKDCNLLQQVTIETLSWMCHTSKEHNTGIPWQVFEAAIANKLQEEFFMQLVLENVCFWY